MLGNIIDGRYRIEKPLGRGGFGHTYLARDLRIPGEPMCVVKQLQPASSEPAYLQVASRLFYSEAEVLAKLGDHDRIPRLLAYFQDPVTHGFFLVEEYIPGETLGQYLAAGQRFDQIQVRQLLTDILELLALIHLRGVIHRDVKPDNLIRRSGDGRWVLIDFGAIKQITQSQLHLGSAEQTVAIGTPGYIPAEQAQGKPRPSSDLYALGMVALHALTGVHPQQFPEDPQTGTAQWQHLAPSLTPPLLQVLTRMTHPYWQERYATAEQVHADLQTPPSLAATVLPTVVLAPETPTATQPAALETPKPPCTRPAVGPWLIGAGGAIAMGSLLAWLVAPTPISPPALVRTTPTPNSGRTPMPESSDAGETLGQELSDGQFLATPEAAAPPLTEVEALDLLRDFIAAKGEFFAPPFDQTRLRELSTGQDLEKRLGTQRWLRENKAFYTYGTFEVTFEGAFRRTSLEASFRASIRETPTLMVGGEKDVSRSQPTRGRYECFLTYADGRWRIAALNELP
jgi:serine/threonine protein kinase